MKLLLICGASICLSLPAHPQDQRPYTGVIYGAVVSQAGNPAKGLKVSAMPLGVVLAMPIPWTKTDDAGNFRFEHLELGRYTVFAEDKEAGYSSFTTGMGDLEGHKTEVELTSEHSSAELNLHLPPPAGFLLFHLTNEHTGAPISGIEVTVTSGDATLKMIFSGGFTLPDPILVPSDRDLLLHVTSWGFHEWEQTVGAGKHIRVAPANKLALDVQLKPASSITERIPEPHSAMYQGIHDRKDWRNPYLVVHSEGIEIVGISDRNNPLTVDATSALLESLPDSAWPYGRVIAIQNISVGPTESQHSRTAENREGLMQRLGELGVIVGSWLPE